MTGFAGTPRYGRTVDLHQWMTTDLAGLRNRLVDSVLSLVPHDRWHEQADGGGTTLAGLVLHVARHQDLAVQTCIRDTAPLFEAHRDALGLADAPAHAAIAEAEDRTVTARVRPEALTAYAGAVFDSTAEWLAPLGSMVLDVVPNTPLRLTRRVGLTEETLPWLHGMWGGKPLWWLVQWPVIGHGNAHVGEAIGLRNRMGLSPF